jgi:hypothetical protein
MTLMKTYSTEHADLANWVRVQIQNGCVRIALCQRVGAENQNVRDWLLTPDIDVDGLAEDASKRMYDEARVLRGPTIYVMFGFKPGAFEYSDRKIFRIEGIGANPDSLLGETEQPDTRGIVSQMMRHNEASARISLGQTLGIVEHYKAILRERDARIAALEAKLEQVGELQHEIVSMQHERTLDLIREKRVDKRTAFVREKLEMLTPVIMSKVLGAGTPKGSGSIFGEEVLRQFLKSLGPQQFAAITGALNPEQVVALYEIFERYSDRETERQKAAAEAEARDIADTTPTDVFQREGEAKNGVAPETESKEQEKK